MPVCYLAGPVDYAQNYGRDWRSDIKKFAVEVGSKLSFFDPPAAYGFTVPDTDFAEYIFDINMRALHKSHVVLARMPKGTTSVGTPIEMYEAYRLNMPMVILTDMKESLTIMKFATSELVRISDLANTYDHVFHDIEMVLKASKECIKDGNVRHSPDAS